MGGNLPVYVLEIIDRQGHLADGNKMMEDSFVINFETYERT